ncbi:MAG: hypothetical protein LBG98_01050 [Puniceicoccales bacterium]|jgi:hypothetical protein|nr:hypothetical protein [Puniceicoccales bacterium]
MDRWYKLKILGVFFVSGLSLFGNPGAENEEAASKGHQDGMVLLQRGVDSCLNLLDIFFFSEIDSLLYGAHRNYETTDDPDLAFHRKNVCCGDFLKHLVEMKTILQGLTKEMDTLIELVQAVRDEPRDPTSQSQARIRNADQTVQNTHQMVNDQHAARLRQRCECYRVSLFQEAQGARE